MQNGDIVLTHDASKLSATDKHMAGVIIELPSGNVTKKSEGFAIKRDAKAKRPGAFSALYGDVKPRTDCDCYTEVMNTIPSPMTDEIGNWTRPEKCPRCHRTLDGTERPRPGSRHYREDLDGQPQERCRSCPTVPGKWCST